MSDGDERLQAFLRGAPPDSVAALPEADREALAELLITARRRQAESLEVAFAATIKFLPFRCATS